MLSQKFCVDSSEEFSVISTKDPAIDRSKTSKEALQEYRESGNEELLVFKPGAVPTRFVFNPLDDKKERGVMARSFASEDSGKDGGGAGILMQYEAFDAAVKAVENWAKPGDSVDPKSIKLAGSIKLEIGQHISRASGLSDADDEPGEDLGK